LRANPGITIEGMMRSLEYNEPRGADYISDGLGKAGPRER